MLFDKPIDFKEAIQSQAAKTILPTTLNAAQLQTLDVERRRWSLFSAKVRNADLLNVIDRALGDILEPGKDSPTLGDLEGLSIPYARQRINEALVKAGYKAPEGKEGTIEDIGSEQRQNLILETQLGMATGQGNYIQGNTPTILQLWPAKELVRQEERKEPRPWEESRWEEACQKVGDEKALAAFKETGRMVALKDSKVWENLGPFQNPYPPYDYNSGMGEIDVDRDDAIDLGLLAPGETIFPEDMPDLGDATAASVDGLSRELREQLKADVGAGYHVNSDGVLVANESRLAANNCGTGAGGFQPGNTCAKGDGGGGEAGNVGGTIAELPGKWKKLSGPLGSNPGGLYEMGGSKYYVKFQKTDDHARNEKLAAALYAIAGAGGPVIKIGKMDGKTVTTSEWFEKSGNQEFSKNDPESIKAARKNFGAHVWLANWDAIGLGFDNQVFTQDGKLRTIDVGGSMFFRAQGEQKTFSADNIKEIDTLRNASVNAQSASIFKGMTDEELYDSLQKVAKVEDSIIDATVDLIWPDAPGIKGILKSRRDLIAKQAKELGAKLGKEKPAEAAKPAAIKQKPVANAPEAIEPVKVAAPSSSSSIGESAAKITAGWDLAKKNSSDAAAKIKKIHDMAAAGDIAGLEAIKTNPNPKAKTYDKKAHAYKMELIALLKGGGEIELGAVGDMAPKALAPAQAPDPAPAKKKEPIKLLASELPADPKFESKNAANVKANKDTIEKIKSIATSGQEDALKAIQAIESPSPKVMEYKNAVLVELEAKQPQKPQLSMENVQGQIDHIAKTLKTIPLDKATAKLGRSIVLGSAPAQIDFPEAKPDPEKAHAKYLKQFETMKKELPGSSKLRSYTGSSYMGMNNSLASGKPTEDAKSAVADITKWKQEIPEGSYLNRFFTGDASLVQHFKNSIGAVIQDPAIISTSVSASTWSGNIHWKITTAKGVKGVYVGGVSMHTSEREMILPPNTRFYIKDVKSKGAVGVEVTMLALPGN